MRNISFGLLEGTILALVGRSGCGKTTLLKCIYGLLDTDAGSISISGNEVTGPSYNLIPGHPRMSLVSQDYYVLDFHTVAENFLDKLAGFDDSYKIRRCDLLLKLLELQSLRDMKASDLSAGQKQRVAIGRALAVMPDLLLLDEPFSNLDNILTEKLFSFIRSEVRKNKTLVILVTHIAEEALKHADQIAVMDAGRILQQGEKWDVYYYPIHQKLAGLLGHYNIIRKEDITGRKSINKKKLLIRPDQIKQGTSKSAITLTLLVTSSVYNGKCYEILAETQNANSILMYSAKKLTPGKTYSFFIGQ